MNFLLSPVCLLIMNMKFGCEKYGSWVTAQAPAFVLYQTVAASPSDWNNRHKMTVIKADLNFAVEGFTTKIVSESASCKK